MQLSSENKFLLQDSYIDNVGWKHECYQQYYKKLKVEGAAYVLHSKDNKYMHVSGNFENIANITGKAMFAEEEALKKIMFAVGAKEYAWQNVEAEKFIKDLKQSQKKKS